MKKQVVEKIKNKKLISLNLHTPGYNRILLTISEYI